MTVAQFLMKVAVLLEERRLYDYQQLARDCKDFAMIALNSEEINQIRHSILCEKFRGEHTQLKKRRAGGRV